MAGAPNTITIVREPVARTVSVARHLRRYGNEEHRRHAQVGEGRGERDLRGGPGAVELAGQTAREPPPTVDCRRRVSAEGVRRPRRDHVRTDRPVLDIAGPDRRAVRPPTAEVRGHERIARGGRLTICAPASSGSWRPSTTSSISGSTTTPVPCSEHGRPATSTCSGSCHSTRPSCPGSSGRWSSRRPGTPSSSRTAPSRWSCTGSVARRRSTARCRPRRRRGRTGPAVGSEEQHPRRVGHGGARPTCSPGCRARCRSPATPRCCASRPTTERRASQRSERCPSAAGELSRSSEEDRDLAVRVGRRREEPRLDGVALGGHRRLRRPCGAGTGGRRAGRRPARTSGAAMPASPAAASTCAAADRPVERGAVGAGGHDLVEAPGHDVHGRGVDAAVRERHPHVEAAHLPRRGRRRPGATRRWSRPAPGAACTCWPTSPGARRGRPR